MSAKGFFICFFVAVNNSFHNTYKIIDIHDSIWLVFIHIISHIILNKNWTFYHRSIFLVKLLFSYGYGVFP